ncbi:MAG: transcriptional regulator [Alphaproteobacteria bacterium]|nr:transcriptional regulator [Alphaproteobacteria bacterium]
MKTVIIGVSALEDVRQRTTAAARAKRPATPRITFATEELLWKTLTPKRFALLKIMAGAGPLGLRELARMVERDSKGVHTDLQALAKARIIEQDAGLKYEFPYDEIRVDFTVRKAA